MPTVTELLANYRTLVEKVDALCEAIQRNHAHEIACRKGCGDCCLHFSIFWVEAVNLAATTARLPEQEAAKLRARAQSAAADGPCPLLIDGVCWLYPSRPIICRTHGLPIITSQDDSRSIDFCPLNFRNVESLPGSAIIDLDRLNDTLAAINSVFMQQFFQEEQPTRERISVAEALLLEL